MARPPPEPCGRAEGLEATDGEDVPPGRGTSGAALDDLRSHLGGLIVARGCVSGAPDVALESFSQRRQVSEAVDPPELLSCLAHPRCAPAQRMGAENLSAQLTRPSGARR
jgi:hypothetical protein